MPEVRAVILETVAFAPKSFHELLTVTQANYSTLTAALESLMSEGRIRRTSDGFQTLYFAANRGAK
jgi:hypothetical protein